MKIKEEYSKLEKELEVEDLKQRCVYYAISRSQRITELNADLGTEGTKSYELIGCYNCDGLTKCEKYMGW